MNIKQVKKHGEVMKWFIDVTLVLFNLPLDRYRIKSDTPIFKVGDWVTDKEDIWQHYACADYDVKVTLWEPHKDEWCVFWDDLETYIVAKFKRKTLRPVKYVPKSNKSTEIFYRNIAPLEFVQTLKDT